MKNIMRYLISSMLIFTLSITVANALMTPTWMNGARFSRGVGNTTYWVSSSASAYTSNVNYAADKWVHTGWDNPIYMTAVSSNYATHIDVYSNTSSSDPALEGTVAAYASFWDSAGNILAPRGYGPSKNYFYTEITINRNNFPSAYRNSIMIHEMGHCFGLSHSNDKNSIMYPYYDTVQVSTVQKVDNDTINFLY